MPGTSLDNIDYGNKDAADAIDEAFNEVSAIDSRAQSQPQAPPQQAPQYQPTPQPPQPQYQAPPQYQPSPQPQYQGPQYPQHPQQPEHFQGYPQPPYGYPPQPEQKSFFSSFTIPDTLKKTLILFVLMIVLTNGSFKNVLTKIPMTVNAEGQHTFIMTLVVASIVSIVFFITSSVF